MITGGISPHLQNHHSTMQNERLNGGEMITVTATLTRDQWSILFMLMRFAAPMLPGPSWTTTDFIIDSLGESYEDAVKTQNEASEEDS